MPEPAEFPVPGKVYKQNNPNNRDFKLWTLTGAVSGYFNKFQIFGDNML